MRARRPHDNKPAQSTARNNSEPCVVCQGKTTGVIDVVELSKGFTFINKNLFPIVFPIVREPENKTPAPKFSQEVGGFHLLQWTSSIHSNGWHNMPLEDSMIVMKRLGALERMLLENKGQMSTDHHNSSDSYVSIIKNYGHLVGGSLTHDHQQIVFTNVKPKRIHDNQVFKVQKDEPFSAYLLRENPGNLLIRDYGPAVLLVPYFMRRPYDMLLLLKDVRKKHIFQLDNSELAAVSSGWQDAIWTIMNIMPGLDREIAFNVITHNGPGAGLYFEFLPYTQEYGGLEQLGLFVCQGEPASVVSDIRATLINKNMGINRLLT